MSTTLSSVLGLIGVHKQFTSCFNPRYHGARGNKYYSKFVVPFYVFIT
jgi:hypothetical protein